MTLLRWLTLWPQNALIIMCSLILTGCGPQIKHEFVEWSNRYQKPCYVKMETLLVDDSKSDGTCKASMGNLSTDDDRPITAFDRVNACADIGRRYIIIRENPYDLWHEMRHIWDAYCLPMAPSANDDVNPKGE